MFVEGIILSHQHDIAGISLQVSFDLPTGNTHFSREIINWCHSHCRLAKTWYSKYLYLTIVINSWVIDQTQKINEFDKLSGISQLSSDSLDIVHKRGGLWNCLPCFNFSAHWSHRHALFGVTTDLPLFFKQIQLMWPHGRHLSHQILSKAHYPCTWCSYNHSSMTAHSGGSFSPWEPCRISFSKRVNTNQM